MDYGATLVRVCTRDRRGEFGDVVLGFDSVGAYERCDAYLGASIGRYANRIARGQFTLDGSLVALSRNEGPHHLHGGHVGFDRAVWSAEPQASNDGVALRFSRRSPAMEEGFPGALDVAVTYSLFDDDVLRIDYRAETDAPTVVNLTNHAYFNLAGLGGLARARSILGHELRIDAEWFVPVDRELIPLGDLASVVRTPFDFRRGTRLGARISTLPQRAPPPRAPRTSRRPRAVREPALDAPGNVHPQMLLAGGYDHAWVLSGAREANVAVAAELYEPMSGRVLTMATTQPALQLYTGNRLHTLDPGREGVPYERYMGLCLETQHLPDSPNQPTYPSTTLRPGEVYRQSTEYRFGVR